MVTYHRRTIMIKFIKKLISDYKKSVEADNMLREYTAIEFIINECNIMDDFVFCKKKIRQFQNRWDKEENSFGSKLYAKLDKQYNSRLIKQKYVIGLYAQKKRKKV